jgi:hypothetical protein
MEKIIYTQEQQKKLDKLLKSYNKQPNSII